MTESLDELKRRAGAGDRPAMLALADALDADRRHDEALNVLERAMQLGDPAAKGRLGVRLLFGDRAPRRPPEGLRLIREATEQGDGATASFAAVLAAIGVPPPRSWTKALDLLARAAELGDASAQKQLAVLADEPAAPSVEPTGGDAAGADVWRRLRARVDVAALTSPPEGSTLCAEPLIRSFPGFATPATCAWLIERSRGRLGPAEVYDALSHTRVTNEMRSNTAANFGLLDTDLVQLFVQAKMAAAAEVPATHMEAPAVLHYDVGEQITEHFDFVDPNVPDYAQQIARDGQRVITFLLYLNDDYEGGQTEFPRLGISHEGVMGEGLFFTNALASGAADVRSVHAGRPPRSGEKWVVSQFIRSRPTMPG